MKRIDETAAAKAYMDKLKAGSYPLERSKNYAPDYCETKEERDTEAVRKSTKSELFKMFKEVN